MEKRSNNFFAGPAALPTEVLVEAQKEMLNFAGTGASVMEISHRSKEFQTVIDEAEADLLNILGLDDDYKILFLSSGATHQFIMLAMNALTENDEADYIVSGKWAQRAQEEGEFWGKANVAASSADLEKKFSRLPEIKPENLSDKARYLHFTSNNTIFGTQFFNYPTPKPGIPLICDMSSDFLSHQFDASKFDMIYAGAQKNIGPSGVTVVVLKKSFAKKVFTKKLPKPLDYNFQIKKGSMFNTPPCFNIYIVGKVFKWVIANGGLKGMEERNSKKADLIYGAIDNSNGFYKGYVEEKSHRSWMNVCFNLPTEELEKKFLAEAAKKEMLGLKGYRDLGGIRASLYNAVSPESVKELTDFMETFRKNNQ